ncbi:WecB/TagA/CpsF family glycosyltransferase [Simiduia agarivorans]|uniref:Diguanylate cyclase/phosphodiesterase n=1 Tax=Simiduia agarivorans (strain DSM 21679 / JCM 13881 / BCRC 17597 / SA1) TaxID=1117647 RepID=K4KNJ3_SIMAS|nr:WecB/TagA/CpsF family glycosyltransferase [Simiduia agarivorans]AFU99800.1 diguanylate cyclase/phosphodiesterase [Simiduia agarivorans SA1 = DSM 21679]
MISVGSHSEGVVSANAMFDRCVALLCVVLVVPVWLVNGALALATRQPLLEWHLKRDDLGRALVLPVFSCGLLRESAYLLAIFKGQLALVGIELECHSLAGFGISDRWREQPAGLFSSYGTLLRVGYVGQSPAEALDQQCENQSLRAYIAILVKAVVNRLLFAECGLRCTNEFDLLGLRIHNRKLHEAVTFVTEAPKNSCKKLFFVNVNSVNLAHNDARLTDDINCADLALVDGSGVRMAARMQGIKLLDNINGTDFLPHLCAAMAEKGQRLFLLGSAPGIAEQAAYNLKTQFPSLQIAGHYHGFFSADQTDDVIEMINASKADVLLVAQGSPRQERWINAHSDWLKVNCALAVGGLLDFTSGRIPRAPQWMCEIGMEWVYRLWQEPYKKFNRYVIGNPVFIARCVAQKFFRSR